MRCYQRMRIIRSPAQQGGGRSLLSVYKGRGNYCICRKDQDQEDRYCDLCWLAEGEQNIQHLLRNRGFEVFGITCKAGVQKKTSVGIPGKCDRENMCNPNSQAKMLNAAKRVNVVVRFVRGA